MYDPRSIRRYQEADVNSMSKEKMIILLYEKMITCFQQAEKALGELVAGGVDPRRVEAVVNGAGYALLQAERTDAALVVFELNTRLFPEASNTWDSLGETHMNLGHDAEAIRFYRKSLELNPENTNAVEMIEKIQESGEENGQE